MERCGFFDAHLNGNEYDRVYLADQFATYFASFISNGVFAEHADQLQVMAMATPQMQITVREGRGWINGYWYENTDELYLPIEVADGVLHRIDSIVLRWGSSERTMWLAVKKGTPAISNPVAPAITRNADYFELQLATVSIPASSISITQAQITDTRLNTAVCGWVTGVVDQIDTSTLFAQFESYFEEFQQSNEQEFSTWFEEVKGQLSEDVAGQLLLAIDENLERIEGYTNGTTVFSEDGVTIDQVLDTGNRLRTTFIDSRTILQEWYTSGGVKIKQKRTTFSEDGLTIVEAKEVT